MGLSSSVAFPSVDTPTFGQHLRFEPLSQNPSLAILVRHTFAEDIQPIYGDQARALAKIFANRDRTCEILLDDDVPVGLLLYKDYPTDEWETLIGSKVLEIKTLIVLDSEKNRGKGYGKALLSRSAELAIDCEALPLCVTVSSAKPQALGFFLHFGFREFMVQYPYNSGSSEHFLFHPCPLALQAQSATPFLGPIPIQHKPLLGEPDAARSRRWASQGSQRNPQTKSAIGVIRGI